MKTNAARVLDRLSVPYEIRTYEVDPTDLSAPTVAAKIGLEPERVFKTLLARGDRGGPSFAIVAADAELSLKALASALGDRKATLVPLKEVLPLTGYVRGGVTVFAAKKAFPVVVDASFVTFERVAVSAGIRGAQLILDPNDYVRVTEARLAPLHR